MKKLLKPFQVDPQIEYEINRKGSIYFAGAKKVKLTNGSIQGRLYIDNLTRKERRKNKLSINNVVIADYDWQSNPETLDTFIRNVDLALLEQYKSRMAREDIVSFFKLAHEHYMSYFL